MRSKILLAFFFSMFWIFSCSNQSVERENADLPGPEPKIVQEKNVPILFPGFILPLKGELIDPTKDPWPKDQIAIVVTSAFSERKAPIKMAGGSDDGDLHKGLDLVPMIDQNRVNKNSQVLATADGVIYIHYPPKGGKFKGHPVYGSLIIIDHGGGIFTLYGHMKETWVREGQRVKQGEPLGIIGSTGISTGIHLHWEIVFDPMRILEETRSREDRN